MLNLRLSRFDTAITALRVSIEDNTSRLAGLERLMGLMQADMRDLRGGVTRQLSAQDEELRVIGVRLTSLEKSQQALIDGQAKLSNELNEIGGTLKEVLRRMPKS